MSYEDRIRQAYPKFSKSFARLADFLLDSYIEAAFMTATELGHAVNVDATTVVRFSQHLGYSGYPDLLREIRDKIRSQLLVQPQKVAGEASLAEVIQTAMDELNNIFEQANKLLEPETMEAVLNKMGEASRVLIVPDPLGRAAAEALRNTLERGGFDVALGNDGVTDLARMVHTARDSDFLLVVEVGGSESFLAPALDAAGGKGIQTAAILGAASLDAAHVTDLVMTVQAQPTQDLGVMLVHAIVYALGQAIRWKYPERYRLSDKHIDSLIDQFREDS